MRALLYDPSTGELEHGGEGLVERWQSKPGSIVWADFDAVDERQRVELLEGVFGLHPLAVQDALRQRHPPKAERFGDVLFVILRGLDAGTKDIDFDYIGISIFVGKDFLLTRHTSISPSIERTWASVREAPETLASADALVVALMDRVVRRYLPILLVLEPRLEEIEAEIFTRPSDELLAELTSYKSSLKRLRRVFTYHGQVLDHVRRFADLGVNRHCEHELTDVVDQVARSASLAQLYYELASDLVDAYLATSAHRLNQVMKVLTVITVIFVPLSFLAGVYGMNFENMPELHSRWGYFILLGIMGCVVAVQLYFFRRKRWL
jgi:magnesium transporter